MSEDITPVFGAVFSILNSTWDVEITKHGTHRERTRRPGSCSAATRVRSRNAKWAYVAGCPVEHIENVELIRDWIMERERDDQ